ncbi:MAG TPA: malto-oligosyltrehalose trehalohydrolase [Verrucomicrobiae bacterium]
MPIGAELAPDGPHFRVWAPASKTAAVQLIASETTKTIVLEPESDGYFSGLVPEARANMFYKFQLDSGAFPDPVSRFQPEGPHGPSQIIDPAAFRWTDNAWRGVTRDGQVIYELHIGTFTTQGTWAAALEQLPELARLGITIIEVMPVADFPGRFGWGYDGVDLFAPTRLYGLPDDFRAFVDRAHALGLGVILDVVYNHIGPDGNYLKEFSPDYFSSRYANEWGEALNFDGPNSAPVREFFVSNAGYWIDEFHLDGLRLDATQQIFDSSAEHVLAAITRRVRAAARGRSTYLVAENEAQHSHLARPLEEGGYGIDALWNDDFHHSATVAVTGRNEAYYSDHHGHPQEFISAMKRGYLFQGQWYSWQQKRRGTPATGLHPASFVNCIQNHDQVANSLRGVRLHELTSPGRFKAITALTLLGPGTPMLFQGEEFAASAPFLYFADHTPELAKLVAAGRRQFLEQFPSIKCAESTPCLANPESKATFDRCKLDFAERERHAGVYAFHRDLLKLRREDPVFRNPYPGGVDGAVLGNEAFVLRYFGRDGDDRLLLVNLGADMQLTHQPEPLLAPVEGAAWKMIWSTEDPRYGGLGMPPLDDASWRLPGHAAIVLATDEAPHTKGNA